MSSLAIGAMLMVQLALVANVGAEPNTFNDPNFKIVWERTDLPVEMFVTQRSYMWGPNTLPGSPSTEPYANSPGGNRTVQYFDKSRMEVNNPNGDRSQLFFVTNGLLVREMTSGMLQLGDTQFEARTPAQEAVAGDPVSSGNTNSPTYATFKPIASLNNDNPSTDKTGQAVTEAIDKAGNVSNITSPDPSVAYAQFDPNLKHNIPNKFVDFLNQTGPIFVNGAIEPNQPVINPVFLAGFPITEAYWVKAKVAGVEKDVLVQLYERRVLTYTPSNPAGFQVEMGNVGQHYFRWRYGTGPVTEGMIVFQSDRPHTVMSTGSVQIWSMKADGSDVKQLTTQGENSEPRWSADNTKIVFTSERDGNPEIYSMNADGSNQTRLTNTPTLEEHFADWNGDGSRIFFAREREAASELFDIWSMAANGTDTKQLTNTANFDNSYPRTSPDGQKIAFASNRLNDGYEIFTMNADGSNPTALTDITNTRVFSTDWKGNSILFEVLSDSNSNIQIWKMNSDGSNQVNVSGTQNVNDREGAYSPNAQRIALSRGPSNQADIFAINPDGSNPQNLTNTTGATNDWPDWSN